MVIENSELKLLLPPQEGVRDLPAQRGPYLVPNRERGSGGDRNSLGVEANGQGSSNR